mgnify:CR=1 FL=1
MKKTNPVWYIVMALTIWCVWNSVARNNLVSSLLDIQTQQQIVLREFAYLTDKIQALEEVEPEVIVKEVKVEVPVEVIREVEVIKEVMIKDTTKVDNNEE